MIKISSFIPHSYQPNQVFDLIPSASLIYSTFIVHPLLNLIHP
ncbi:MAG: hypothetical protein ABIT05_11190 [Chitinophagaceae bacterium]